MSLPPKGRAPLAHRIVTLLRTHGDMTAREIVRALRVSRQSAYRTLDRLEAWGLVERITDPRGRRVAVWKLKQEA